MRLQRPWCALSGRSGQNRGLRPSGPRCWQSASLPREQVIAAADVLDGCRGSPAHGCRDSTSRTVISTFLSIFLRHQQRQHDLVASRPRKGAAETANCGSRLCQHQHQCPVQPSPSVWDTFHSMPRGEGGGRLHICGTLQSWQGHQALWGAPRATGVASAC